MRPTILIIVITTIFWAIVLIAIVMLLFTSHSPAVVAAVMAFSTLGLVANSWALFAGLRARQARQDELALLLSATVTAGLPIAPAIRSYLADRQAEDRGTWKTIEGVSAGLKRALVVGALVMLLVPFLVFSLFTGLDQRSARRFLVRFRDRLEDGMSLSESLDAVPGVVSREVRLAVKVGESSGALGDCLKVAQRERWSTAWVELAPRVAYPLLILAFTSAVMLFLIQFILPKYKKIFDEFGAPLPQLTQALFIDPVTFSLVVFVILASVPAGISLLAFFPGARWRAPFVGKLYRWGVQGELLRTLGRLLDAGRTVPASLDFLAQAHAFPAVVQKRIDAARAAVDKGEPLEQALAGADLLPPAMAPLLRSATATHTLPWALRELGEHLSMRTAQVFRRTMQWVSPLVVIVIGAMVGFVAVAMFLPLVNLLSRLSV